PQHATPSAASRSSASESAPADAAATVPAGTEPAAAAEPVAERPAATAPSVEHEADVLEPAEREDSVTPEEEAPGSPEPLTSEKPVPWFAAEVTDVTERAAPEAEAADTQTADPEATTAETETTGPSHGQTAAVTGSWTTGEGSEPMADESPASTESEAQDGAVVQQGQGAVVAAEDSGEASPEAPEDGTVTEAEGEPGGAAASVEDDARADATVQPGLSSESGPGGVAPRDAFEQVAVSEHGEPMRPRGGAHRRQSGLLSTLTGFRRRGRGSRRD
ncbi:hypothetical protein CWC38_09420, partial [Kocuria tytonicola]